MLGKKINLTVLFEARTEHDRKWVAKDKFNNFNCIYLKGFTIKHTNFHINYSFLKYIKDKNSIVIVGGYHSIANIISILYLRFIIKKKFILLHDGCFFKSGNKLLLTIKKLLINSANRYLLSGTNAINEFSKYGASKEDMVKAYFTCDIKKLTKQNKMLNKDLLRKKLEFANPASKLILCVARLVKEKGILDLINAAKDINNLKVILIGSGKYESYIRKYIKLAKIDNVILAGYKTENEISKFYKVADVFVLPSYYDPWGMVINEAMCFELPIITTNMTGSSYDLVKNGYNGYIIKPGDIVSLRKRIIELKENNIKRIKFGKRSFDLIKEWNLNKSVDSYFKCINGVRS
jgi:glycosyltransferase involved in cell wall biosynthesis